MKHYYIIFAVIIFFTGLCSCKKDPCDGVKCLNGGYCIDGNCDCPPGYSGANCQYYDPCYNTYCLNGGHCDNGTCDCPPGYAGVNCETKLSPKSITILSIVVNTWPYTNNGYNWDTYSGADPFVSINSGTSSNLNDFTSGNYVDPPFGTVLTYSNINISLSPLNIYWSAGLWDYDGTSDPSDFMGGYYFKPIDNTNGFPASIVLYNSATPQKKFTLNVRWNF